MYMYDLAQTIPSLSSISGPGSFVHLDNLAIGLPRNVPHKGDSGLSLVEARSHFGIWCMMTSPLILNFNIFPGGVDPQIFEIVSHVEAIAINQASCYSAVPSGQQHIVS